MSEANEISPELVQRMVTHLRGFVDKYAHIIDTFSLNGELREAREIVAELPAPVDSDLIEARALRLEELGEHASSDYKRYLSQGSYDREEEIQRYLRAIKRGRELAEAGK